VLKFTSPGVQNLTTIPDRPNPTIPENKIELVALRDAGKRIVRPKRAGIVEIGRPPWRPTEGEKSNERIEEKKNENQSGNRRLRHNAGIDRG
jgi:hypothetical protein